MANDRLNPGEFYRSGLGRTAACPPPEALERLVKGSDPTLSAHIASCGYCRTELELMRSFELADVPAEDRRAVQEIAGRLAQQQVSGFRPAAPPRRAWWRLGGTWLRPAVLSAAGILVVVAIALELRHGAPPALRGVAGGTQVYRSQSLAVLSPSGDLQSVPRELRWEPVASAVTYRVRILEVDGNELWSAATADTAIALPPAVQARFVPAKTLLVNVTALDGHQQKLAESDNVRMRILQNLYPR